MGKLFSKKKPTQNSKIGKDTTCPICGKFFPKKSTYDEVNIHIDYCTTQESKMKEEVKEDPFINMESNSEDNHNPNPFISPSYIIQDKSLANLPFENKFEIFKKQMKSLKVDWRDGCCTLSIIRETALEQSIEQLNYIDLYRELKINFLGEVSSDAGGLIREWYTVIFKELQNEKRRLFQRSENEEYSFIIHRNILSNVENLVIFNFIGKIIGKALLENLSINSCLNKIFYKMILNEEITLKDLEHYDKSLYLSLMDLKKRTIISDLEMYFVIDYEADGKIYSENLISNGSNILLTNNNLDLYIERRIQYILNQNKVFVCELQAGLFSIIHKNYINMFNSEELELVLNGISTLSIEDWKENTNYQGNYNSNHKVIKWFWRALEKLNDDDKVKFLQFSTGTSRLPIGGFKFLESNRGQIAKFCVVSVEYSKGKQNYIRAHTCFNRIDLPKYNSEAEVTEAINYAIKNNVYGFGID